ncbi:Peptidase M28 family protein [Candidatus Sulfotelmatobacter sp. SbA7]|nr:Peptidase M28 family protein [Candidatus Sulfotelmatobacter sp. SbA7]
MRTAKICCLLLVVAAAFAQQPGDKIIAEALKPSPLETNLRRLTDEIGGRVPGTPAMQRAVAWGSEAFKAAGADSVHTENFTIKASWAEGATKMTVVAPESFVVRAVSLAWAPALAPQQHVRIISIGHGTAEDFANAGNFAGDILLVSTSEMHTWEDLFAEYLNAPGIIDLAVKGKALAIAFQSTRPHDLLYRHTNSLAGEIDRLPMVMVAREDAGRMARLLESGQKLYADLAIPNRVGGPITATNVVAELRGSEKPDEFVVLGAHLDSWELGTGALDNGCNAALVIDALRAIKGSGLQPRRSMRFILFSGEEEGLLGSHAYVRAHRSELDKDAGMVVWDSGSGKTTGFSLGGRKDLVDAVTAMVAPLQQFGATTLTTDMSWGTDHFDFMLEGVPTFMANQQEANYLINYHAMSDTFDKVDMEQLKKHVAEAAYLSFSLANSAERVGPRYTRAQIEQAMHETHADELMKTFGMWDEWQKGKLGRTE